MQVCIRSIFLEEPVGSEMVRFSLLSSQNPSKANHWIRSFLSLSFHFLPLAGWLCCYPPRSPQSTPKSRLTSIPFCASVRVRRLTRLSVGAILSLVILEWRRVWRACRCSSCLPFFLRSSTKTGGHITLIVRLNVPFFHCFEYSLVYAPWISVTSLGSLTECLKMIGSL